MEWGSGVCPEVILEGWLRCFAHLLGGTTCRGHAQYPVFAPDPLLLLQALQKWQLFLFLFSVSLYLLGPEFVPTVHTHRYFFSPMKITLWDSLFSSFDFVSQGEVCPGASTAAKGLRTQPVSISGCSMFCFLILIIPKLLGNHSDLGVCTFTARERADTYPCWRPRWRSRPQWSWQPWSGLSRRPASAWAASQSSEGPHARILRAWGAPAASLSPWDEAASLAWCRRRPGYTAKEGVALSTLSWVWLSCHCHSGSSDSLLPFSLAGIWGPLCKSVATWWEGTLEGCQIRQVKIQNAQLNLNFTWTMEHVLV